MILFINTTDPKKTTIVLDKGGHFFSHEFKSEFHQTEKLLREIDSFLKKKKIHLKSLKGIIAVSGPGPFTALRIGVIVANTLGYSLNIKIAGLKQQEFSSVKDMVEKGRVKLKKAKGFRILKPYYGKEPNITVSKRK